MTELIQHNTGGFRLVANHRHSGCRTSSLHGKSSMPAKDALDPLRTYLRHYGYAYPC